MADNAQRTVAMLTERPKTPVRQAIDKLPIEKQWEVTENLSLHAMRHSLVISKRPVEKPKFNQDTLDWVPQFVPGSSLTKSGEVFMFARPGVGGLKLPPLAAAMISLAKSDKTFRQMAAEMPVSNPGAVVLGFYHTMWKQGHVWIKMPPSGEGGLPLVAKP